MLKTSFEPFIHLQTTEKTLTLKASLSARSTVKSPLGESVPRGNWKNEVRKWEC